MQMNEQDWIKSFQSEADALQRRSISFQHHDTSAQIAIRLLEAMEQRNTPGHDTLRVALWGGTGSGKSTLFNSMCDMPAGEGVSDGKRAFTCEARIAASRQDIALVKDWGAVVKEQSDGATTMVDCPDIDSVKQANWKVAEAILSRADVVVLVTTPDKRANFDIAAQVKKWASRKRWFFVMNKVEDLRPEEIQSAREDFYGRICDLGFRANADVTFLISAKDKSHDYERLRRVLFSQRSAQRVRALAQESMLKRLLFAFDDDLVQPFADSLAALREALKRLRTSTERAYTDALHTSAREVLCRLKRERVWQKLAGRVGGSMALAIWMRARLGYVIAAASSGTLLARGHGLAAVARMLWTSIGAVISQQYTLKQLLAGQRESLRRRLGQIADDARRELEDAGIHVDMSTDTVARVNGVDVETAKMESRYRAGLRLLGLDLPRTSTSVDDVDLSSAMNEAIDASATDVLRSFPRVYGVFANLLPLWFAGVFVLRLTLAWKDQQYEDMGFFLNFVGVFLLAHIPGYLLAACWVARKTTAIDDMLRSIVSHVPLPGPVLSVEYKLATFVSDVMAFRSRATGWLTAMSRELRPESFGACTPRQDAAEPEGDS